MPKLAAAAYIALILLGCASKPPVQAGAAIAANPTVAATPAEAGDKTGVKTGVIGEPVSSEPPQTTFPGSGQFINPQPSNEPAAANLNDQEVSFNFEATPVPEVVKTILGDLLQETYVIGPGVGGTVTFATAKPIKGQQAMAVLEMLLSWSGASLVRKNGQYLVVQTQAAVPGNLSPQLNPVEGQGYSVRAVPLKFISATQMEELLKPYAKQGAVLKADNARSLVVLAGTRTELESYLNVINTFDVDWMAGMSFALFNLERVEVKDIMPELEAIFGDAAATGAAASPLAGMVRMLPIERLNAIMVITPQPSYLKQVEGWIKRLDRGGGEGGSRLYVYDVRNVKATDLADRLNEIFNGQAAAPRQERNNTRGQVAPGLGGQTLGSSGAFGQPAPIPQPRPTPTPTPAAGGAAGGAGKSLLGEQEVRITAVEDNNSLLISSTPAQYDILKSAIMRLDVEPLQVKIEAKLLEVNLVNNLRFGVQWFFERGIGATAATPLAPTDPNVNLRSFSGLGGTLSGGSGINYVFDGPSARAFVDALQSESNTNMLSSPTLLVLNNKSASIQVGQQIAQQAGTTTGVGFTNGFVQFRDVGLILDVTPRVNPGGLVYLEIQQQQSSIGAEVNEQASVNQKTITTEVAVQSGQTIVLGGLIQEAKTKSNNGLPGLKNLPVIGRLFGSSKDETTRTETLVLITPTVVEGGSEKMREITDEYVRRFKGLDPLIDDGVIPPAPKKGNLQLRDGELLSTPPKQQ